MSRVILNLFILSNYIQIGVAINDRVLMRDIDTLTFNQGQYTTNRRVPAEPQLTCVGGDAQSYATNHIIAVQCYKKGSSGYGPNKIQWKCYSDNLVEYKLGQITVGCEGYHHSDDPYILDGSCGLKYTLHHSGGSNNHYHYNTLFDAVFYAGFFVLCVIVLIIWIIFCKDTPNRRPLPRNYHYENTYVPPNNHHTGASFISGIALGSGINSLLNQPRQRSTIGSRSSRRSGGTHTTSGVGGTHNR
jgi:hypothetical protein